MNKISVYPDFFQEKERTIVTNGTLSASVFRYDTGVCAIRVQNPQGYYIVLPYQGQQVWRMEFLNHAVTMKSSFDKPIPTKNFHENYGMFLLHCGLTAMGNPGPQDKHPQHGELPFADFRDAFLTSGSDEKGRYLSVGGYYHHARAFSADYGIQVSYRLYETGSTILCTVAFENYRDEPLEYFYMCHINFRPVDGSRLSYSAHRTAVKPHYWRSDRLSPEKQAAYDRFFQQLQQTPEIQDAVDRSTQMYEPEICSTVSYLHDEDNNAYCMQIMPDGYACYVRYDPTVLPIGLRWIARTGTEDAMGMVLPATAEHLGYHYCKAHHMERYLEKGQRVVYQIETGVLSPDEARQTDEKIQHILAADC